MLKMGQMCHCTTYWTIASFDADGNLRYRIDPYDGVATSSLITGGLLLDGTDLYIVGTEVSGEDDGVLQKWQNIDASPSRVWYSDRNSQTQYGEADSHLGAGVSANLGRFKIIAKSNDGAIWSANNSGGARWSSSGVQSGFFSGGHAVQEIAGSSDMHVTRKSTSPVIRYDSSLSTVDTADTVGFTADHTIPAGTGFFAIDTANASAFFDSSLTSTATGTGGVNAACTNDGAYVYMEFTSGNTVRKYSSAYALQWGTTNGLIGTSAICDSNDDLYIGSTAGTGSLRKISGSDGSIAWTITGYDPWLMRIHSTGNIITAGQVTGQSVVKMIEPDGTVLWTAVYADVSAADLSDIREDADGNVYVSGERIKREGGSDSIV